MPAVDHTYVADPLRLSSPIQLPGLQRTNEHPDVTIEYGRVDTQTTEPTGSDITRLTYDGIGTFEVRDGSRVVLDRAAECSDDALVPYLIGPLLGAVLHQRGYLVLHASSVAVRDTAVAFLGSSGSGKSTIAAAFQASGHAVLSDDITAVEIETNQPVVVPGLPLLKLDPGVADRLDLDDVHLVHELGDKSLYQIQRGSQPAPRQLERLYLLTDGGLHSQKLSPGESVRALVGHTYTQSLLEESSIGSHFRQCAHVADSVEVDRLSRPRALESLPETVRLIEGQLDR